MINIRKIINENTVVTKIIYILVSILILYTTIVEIINRNWLYTSLGVITYIIINIPFLIEQILKIKLSSTIKILFIIFIFSCTILGEINHFYITFKYYDTIIHGVNGFISAGIGFLIANMLCKDKKNKPYYLLLSFAFAMVVGVSWEFCEYGMDKFFLTDTQKDTIVTEISSLYLNKPNKKDPKIIKNIEYTIIYHKNEKGKLIETKVDGYLDIGLNDTMKDLLVTRIGAFVFTTFAYFYLKDNNKFSFIKEFIAKRPKKEV